MLVKKYSTALFEWVLDPALLSEQESADLRTLAGAQGSYGAGSTVAGAIERLAAQGVTVRQRLDGAPLVFIDGV